MGSVPLSISGPGPVVLFGSGETSPSGRNVFDRVLQELAVPPRLALLETPAGFEPNSDLVIGRVADFLRHHLQNYRPQIDIVAARKRGTPFSPDDPQIAAALLEADMIFMGPGSPTYAVRQLRDSLAWYYLQARYRLGAALVFASAATIAVSAYALPVYEIYKVGEDLHWKKGLDFFGMYGLPLVFIPHWNNTDGGEELDTSRCFMGQSRFAELMTLIPADLTVVGIDEKTALILDIQSETAQVVGLGSVTLIHNGHTHHSSAPDLQGTGLDDVAMQRHGHVHRYMSGSTFSLNVCCPFEVSRDGTGLPDDVWTQALEVQTLREEQRLVKPEISPHPPEIVDLVEARQAARAEKDWVLADALRDQIASLGWLVNDTPDGVVVEPKGQP